MEPDGHFVLVALADGRTIVDLKLDAEPALSDILLVRSDKQYLLLTANAAPPGPNSQALRAIGSVMTAYPIRKGRMVSFDEAGKLLWPAPVSLEDQMYFIGQAEASPVIVLACQIERERRVLCVEKRSGRIVYRNDSKPCETSWIDIVVDPNKKTVELRTAGAAVAGGVQAQNETVTLTFTDRPLVSADAAIGSKVGGTRCHDGQ